MLVCDEYTPDKRLKRKISNRYTDFFKPDFFQIKQKPQKISVAFVLVARKRVELLTSGL